MAEAAIEAQAFILFKILSVANDRTSPQIA